MIAKMGAGQPNLGGNSCTLAARYRVGRAAGESVCGQLHSRSTALLWPRDHERPGSSATDEQRQARGGTPVGRLILLHSPHPFFHPCKSPSAEGPLAAGHCQPGLDTAAFGQFGAQIDFCAHLWRSLARLIGASRGPNEALGERGRRQKYANLFHLRADAHPAELGSRRLRLARHPGLAKSHTGSPPGAN